MRILFSIIGLLVVLAIVGVTVKQQLSTVAAPSSATPAGTSQSPDPTPQQTIQQAQDEVRRSLEQGAARASEADR